MPAPLFRALYVTCLSVAGSVAGYAYARHQIALSIAYMRAHWGWVCGTGLEVPLVLFTPLGALVGFALGVVTWRLASRFLI